MNITWLKIPGDRRLSSWLFTKRKRVEFRTAEKQSIHRNLDNKSTALNTSSRAPSCICPASRTFAFFFTPRLNTKISNMPLSIPVIFNYVKSMMSVSINSTDSTASIPGAYLLNIGELRLQLQNELSGTY